MDPSLFVLLAAIVVLTLAFDFINGFHDAANAIATVVSTRVMTPTAAIIYGAILNFIGALMGTEVAATIGKGLVDATSITLHTVLFTVIGAIIWNLFTWYKGLPTSSSHAIIGSLLGASFFSGNAGSNAIHMDKVFEKVVIPMLSSPVMGVALGFSIMTALTWIVCRMTPSKVNKIFGKLQILSAGFMALNHGRNDAQKCMGIIALALVLAYPQEEFSVPLWVIASCAIAMGLGTMAGGWRIIHTMGSKMIRLQPAQGFAAETSASLILAATAHFGIPVSTTHVISTSIIGAGTSKRFSAVRWGIVGTIVWAWILTIPLTFALSGGLMWIYETLR
ncbi:MAG: inorganic phosphate transporter [Alphaproteobacteria bacterium]